LNTNPSYHRTNNRLFSLHFVSARTDNSIYEIKRPIIIFSRTSFVSHHRSYNRISTVLFTDAKIESFTTVDCCCDKTKC